MAFFIIYVLRGWEDVFMFRIVMWKVFWDRANGGRKSFKLEELRSEYEIEITNQIFIHYLSQINRDLSERDE